MRWATYLGYLTLIGSLGGTCFGIWRIYDQNRWITTFESIDTQVVSQRIEERKAKYFVLKLPVIEFEYTVEGRKYTSERTTPTECAGTTEWAEGVLEAYPIGRKVRARFDPRKPSDSYLIAKYGAEPYTIVLVTLVIAGMGLGVILEQVALSVAPSESQDSVSGTLLKPKRDHRSFSRTLFGVGMMGVLIGTPVAMHYLLVSTPPHDKIFLLFVGAFGIAVLVVIVWAMCGHWASAGFGTPELRMSPQQPVIGENIRITCSLPTRFAGMVRWMTLRLRCEAQKTAWFDISDEEREFLLLDQSEFLFQSTPVQSHGTLDAEVQFHLPIHVPPSSPTGEKSNMRIVWTLTLEGEGSSRRSLKNEYILRVEKITAC